MNITLFGVDYFLQPFLESLLFGFESSFEVIKGYAEDKER